MLERPGPASAPPPARTRRASTSSGQPREGPETLSASVPRRPVTILLSSAGRRVELLRCFQADAQALNLSPRVVATDCEPAWSAACAAADRHYGVPPVTDPGFIPRMLEICASERVDLVVPTIDPELRPLARARPEFEAVGTAVAISAPGVVMLAGDKLMTARVLAEGGVPVPRTDLPAVVLAGAGGWPWPLLLKPRGGSASAGIRILAAPAELAPFGTRDDHVVQELVRGPEYTVNLFFDAAGRLRTAVPHRRWEIRAGEVAKGETGHLPALEAAVARLGDLLHGARGALCCQAIVTDEGPQIFELNARFGGGYPLAHAAGATFSRWLIEETLGLPSTCHDRWRAGLRMLRYDAACFVDTGAARA